MSQYDQIYSALPETTKARLLNQLTMWRNDPVDGLFETAAQFNAHEEEPLSFLVDGLLDRKQLAMLGGRAACEGKLAAKEIGRLGLYEPPVHGSDA